MNKRVLRGLLTTVVAIVLMMGVCAPAMADASDISVYDAVYYEDGGKKTALKSVTCEFDWYTASVEKQRLVLMTKKLGSDDLTDLGTYGNDYKDFDEVLSHDKFNNTFGIISYSDEKGVKMGSSDNKREFDFAKSDIPLDVDKTYYVYLWTYWSNNYYPDNLFCELKVEDGVVKYSDTYSGFKSVDDDNAPEQPKNDDKQTEEEPKEPAELPETGDAFDAALWILLLCVGCAGIALMTRKSREENN